MKQNSACVLVLNGGSSSIQFALYGMATRRREAAWQSRLHRLLAGVRLFEYQPAMTQAKIVIFDRWVTSLDVCAVSNRPLTLADVIDRFKCTNG